MVEEIDQSTQALRNSEQRYRIVTEFTNDFTYWRRPDGSFEFISPACLEVTGYSREELFAQPSLMEEMIHPGDRELFNQMAAENGEDGNCSNEELEYRIITKGGSARWYATPAARLLMKTEPFWTPGLPLRYHRTQTTG